jgi:copper chaperone NosL
MILIAAALVACGKKEEAAAPPPPREATADAIAQFCNMSVTEHPGPKGQIFIKSKAEPFWFASVRDAFAFTMLPEEPKDIAAIYVNDMSTAPDWDHPGPWIDARKAVFVIDSKKRGGMGEAEAVPFADEAKAKEFLAANGGKLVRFDEMPRKYILPEGDVAPGEPPHTDQTPAGETKTDGGAKDGGAKMQDMPDMH